jgi:hypothetical protein
MIFHEEASFVMNGLTIITYGRLLVQDKSVKSVLNESKLSSCMKKKPSRPKKKAVQLYQPAAKFICASQYNAPKVLSETKYVSTY